MFSFLARERRCARSAPESGRTVAISGQKPNQAPAGFPRRLRLGGSISLSFFFYTGGKRENLGPRTHPKETRGVAFHGFRRPSRPGFRAGGRSRSVLGRTAIPSPRKPHAALTVRAASACFHASASQRALTRRLAVGMPLTRPRDCALHEAARSVGPSFASPSLALVLAR